MLLVKKYLAEFLKRKKISGSLNQWQRILRDQRNGPKIICESHDTGLGITFFDA